MAAISFKLSTKGPLLPGDSRALVDFAGLGSKLLRISKGFTVLAEAAGFGVSKGFRGEIGSIFLAGLRDWVCSVCFACAGCSFLFPRLNSRLGALTLASPFTTNVTNRSLSIAFCSSIRPICLLLLTVSFFLRLKCRSAAVRENCVGCTTGGWWGAAASWSSGSAI